MIPYKLVRSNRKTIGIYVTKQAEVEVRAPLKAPKADIEKFVRLKEKWIENHLAQQRERKEQRESFGLTYGDEALFCGRRYPIVARDGNMVSFDSENFCFPPSLSQQQIKRALIQLYRQLARRVLTSRVAEYAQHMNVFPSDVKITGARTRWGSCSSKGSVNFSWRLVMAEVEIIDYVVVHELTHIRELNHSQRFWSLVESVLPDFRLRRDKLRQFQLLLAQQDWDGEV